MWCGVFSVKGQGALLVVPPSRLSHGHQVERVSYQKRAQYGVCSMVLTSLSKWHLALTNFSPAETSRKIPYANQDSNGNKIVEKTNSANWSCVFINFFISLMETENMKWPVCLNFGECVLGRPGFRTFITKSILYLCPLSKVMSLDTYLQMLG